MAKRPELVIVGGTMEGRRFTVKTGGLRLGRSSSNDIHMPDEELSRNHCLFEPVGETGIRVTDLASANGTFVNGKAVGGTPVDLKEGDRVTMGRQAILVGEPVAVPSRVDLGLGTRPAAASAAEGAASSGAPAKGRGRLLFNVLSGVAIVCLIAAIAFMLVTPKGESEPPPKPVAEVAQTLTEVQYEKVVANERGIFRFAFSLTPDRTLTARIDDVPNENRHLVKSVPLSDASFGMLNEILAYKTLREIDREYVGVEPDPPALESWTLKAVYTTRQRTVRVVNTTEPEAFRIVREKLEAFCKSELGIWAIQYPREKLLELAEEAIRLGEQKWEDRDANYGNLAASFEAFREAEFYLETINPKPPCHETAREGKARAETELAKRYADQRFVADRAINLSQWAEAKEALGVLLEMVPDRRDERHRDAEAKLISAESHLKKGGR